MGTFGSGGYDLAAWNGNSDLTALPSTVSSLSLVQGSRFVWAQNTTDVRALQSPDKITRRAATYYNSTAIKVTLSFSSFFSGNLHLYAVDWDSQGRRESISVNGATVDTLNTDFSQGAWVTVPVSVLSGGTVTIQVDRIAGVNAVLSGIFLGDAGAPPAAMWTQAPQGSWVDQFGSGGYDLAAWNGSSDLTSLPSAVSSLSLVQGSRYVWAQNTTDVRALQSPDKSTRRAATYDSSTAIKVVLTFRSAFKGTMHLYAVDWDSPSRRESVSVNGAKVATLNADFSQGAWIAAPVSVIAGGTVTIQVDRIAGVNAVLSGIFFDASAPGVQFFDTSHGKFSCNGVVTTTPPATADTAVVTSNPTTVTAQITINSLPVGTFYSGQLWQSNCSRTKNFQGTVPLNRQVTVTDSRAPLATGAFLQITPGTGLQENSTLAPF